MKLQNIQELSPEIGIPVRTIRSLAAAGKIPFFKLGHRTMLFDPSKVLLALNKFEIKAATEPSRR